MKSSKFLALVVLALAACDWNESGEIQNSSNFAVVRAQFFASRANRVPVPGVRMIVEADPNAGHPYHGPDVISVSGEDGIAVAEVFLGLMEQQQGAGGTGGEQRPGARNPLELPAPLHFGDAAVVVLYQGQTVRLIGGLTIASGHQYDLGAVFLDELQIVVG